MRCFIAIDINEEIRAAIADLQKQLAAKIDIKKGDVKWVEPENIHLTLKFLGEIKDEQAAEVCEISKQVADAHKNFDIDIESVGSFGGRSAKVVWVGAGKGTDELLALQKDLEDRLAQAGYPKEDREFSAHLTLCRVRNPKAGFKLADACKAFENYKLGSLSADAVCVYQSQLTPAGPIYTLLGSFKLVRN
jgi:2'-5' RNA ligase